MLPQYAYIANTLLFLLMASLQMGVFGDLFDDDDDDQADAAPLPEDGVPDPLYIPSLYSDETFGTPDMDSFLAGGGAPNQAFFLGAGDDVLDATAGADFAQGGSGDDRLLMRDGADLALGGSGNDQIFGGTGDDTAFGGDGDDLIEGSTGDDALHGGDGNDRIAGGRDDDIVTGGAGDDTLSGDRFDGTGGIERGVDRLDGGDGDDVLWLFGTDSGTGGDGADTFRVIDADDGETTVTITDFDLTANQLEVVYTEGEGDDAAVPELTVSAIPDTNDASVLLDGEPIATLAGGAGLLAEDVVLTSAL